MKKQLLALALLTTVFTPAAHARAKLYDFPGVQQRTVDAQGAPVEGVRFDFEIRMHQRKFWGWALFPPADLLVCEMGKALGGVISGWFGGPHAPVKTCWQVWQEDVGLKTTDQIAEYDYPVTDATGLAQYGARRVWVETHVHSFTPGLLITAKQLETTFEYTSALTPTTQLVCAKHFAEPTCAVVVPGKSRINEAAKNGLSCTVPMTTEQLAAFRASAVEQCRTRLTQVEAFYKTSYPVEFGKTVQADGE